jgi:microtubule-associated protein-like 1/2
MRPRGPRKKAADEEEEEEEAAAAEEDEAKVESSDEVEKEASEAEKEASEAEEKEASDNGEEKEAASDNEEKEASVHKERAESEAEKEASDAEKEASEAEKEASEAENEASEAEKEASENEKEASEAEEEVEAKVDEVDGDEYEDEHEEASEKGEVEAEEEEVVQEEAEENEDVPDELISAAGTRAATAKRPVSRLDIDSLKMDIRGRNIVLRIPEEYRESYDPDATVDAPEQNFNLDWAYGCPRAENIKFLYDKGEIMYPVGAVIVMYHIESHTQRFYTGHTNAVTCIAIHPEVPMVASGQAEGHSDESSTIQKPHVQIWNYDDGTFIRLLGVDMFEYSIKCLAFSGYYDGAAFLAVIDADQSPNLKLWTGLEEGVPKLVGEAKAHSDEVVNVYFYPEPSNIMLTTGKSHVTMWNIQPDGEEVLQKKSGLFTRKIPRPKMVTCAAFAKTGEVLTGDSDGNVMIWRGVKVVRVLKGAHAGAVGDIVVMEDGSFVSGGLNDDSLVVFNENYELIGAGAVLPEALGGIKKILVWKFVSLNEAESRHYHLYIGTERGCVADCVFSVNPNTTEVDMEVETLIQGNGGEITGVSAFEDNFITCGKDKTIIMWDSVAHKSKWLETVRAPLSCVAMTQDGTKFAAGASDGYLYYTDVDERSLLRIKATGGENITTMAFSSDGSMLALGAMDHKIYLCYDTEMLPETFEYRSLEGHTSHVTHIDFTVDGLNLRSNSSDLELLFWDLEGIVTNSDEIDAILSKPWASQNCTLTFETIGIWPQIADGTDVNTCAASNDLVAVGDDFGRVRLYKYPAIQSETDSVELLGHSDHVKNVAFSDGQIISAGGREASLLQWKEAAT